MLQQGLLLGSYHKSCFVLSFTVLFQPAWEGDPFPCLGMKTLMDSMTFLVIFGHKV